DDALAQHGRLHHAAVEEERGRMEERRAVLSRAREPFELRERLRLSAEERGEVLGDRGVGRVREAERRERGARADGGAPVRGDGGEEPFDERLLDLVARELAANAAAEELRSARRDRDRRALLLRVAEQELLRAARRVHERRHLPTVDLFAVGLDLLLHDVRE